MSQAVPQVVGDSVAYRQDPAIIGASLPVLSSCLPETDPYRGRIKLWPMLGLAANHARYTGGWRAWVLAHALDTQGSGKVGQGDLRAYLDHLGLNRRSQGRWMAQAKTLEIIRESKNDYYLVSLAKAAIALKCPVVGKPAIIEPGRLVKSGWKAYIWGAYLTTLSGHISQKVKEQMTGISPRSQRNYQGNYSRIDGKMEKGKTLGRAVQNYARMSGPKESLFATGLRDVTGKTVFIDNNGQLVQRLPDFRIVYESTAVKHDCMGRTRKAQKTLNAHSFNMEREQCASLRLFHNSHKQAENKARNLGTLPPWRQPSELFVRAYRGENANRWEIIDLAGGESTHAILH